MHNILDDVASHFRRRAVRRTLIALTFAILVLCGPPLQADVIYREIFGRPDGAAGNINPTNFHWAHFNNAGAAVHTGNGLSADGVAGKPADLANVNAGNNVDGTTGPYAEGWHYFDQNPRSLSFTPEYVVDPADYVPGSIVFSWYQGNANLAHTIQVIVKVGGVWYVSAQTIVNSTVVASGANFGNPDDGSGTAGAQFRSLTFNPAAANWLVLNFDGTYDHTTGIRVNSTLGTLSVGDVAEADLVGPITAFGLYGDQNGTSGNRRFDTFTIEANPNVGTPPKSVRWEGGQSADWDTFTTNWRTNGGPATTFATGDFVRFDDLATGPTNINLTASFQPGSITVSNQSLAYEFGGGGSLGGIAGLTKQGTGLLVITNLAGNSFSGPILISAGTVQVGAGDVGGSLGSGTFTNNGALVLNRAGNLTINNAIHGPGALTQNGPGNLTLNGISSYTGNTLVNAGSLVLNGNLSGGGQLTIASGTTLRGSGTNTGPVVSSGDISPGTSPGTLTFGALTLNTGATLAYEANTNNTVGGGINDLLQVNGNFTLNNNSLAVTLLEVPQTGVPYRVANFTGTRSGAFNPAVTVVGGSRFTPALSYDNGAGQVNLTFSGSTAALRWAGDADFNWDLGTTANWTNLGNNLPDVFYHGDTVLFDDTPGLITAIEIPENVVLKPALFTVNSTNNWYSFTSLAGGGRISGGAAIVKNGDSTLTLSTANDFTGPVSVNQGTLVVGHNTALGTAAGATTIASGATLDVGNPAAGANAVNVGTEPIFGGGGGMFDQGAIVNNSFAGQQNALQRVTLTGHTVFGGSARWDIRAGSGALLSTGGNPYNLTKLGANQINIVNATVDPTLAAIEVQSGQLGIEGSTTSLGNPANPLTVFSGATLRLTTLANILNKVAVLQDGATLFNTGGSNVFGGPVMLQGNVTFNIAGTALMLTNVISGSGGLSKTISGSPLFLTASNSYTGPTHIEAGTLTLSGNGSIRHSTLITVLTTLNAAPRTDGTLTLASGQKLEGSGGINGSLLAGASATVSPGSDTFGTIGTLTVSNLVTLQGTTYMELDKASFIQDQLIAGPVLNYGGTLVATNLSESFAPLEVGDSFHLFDAVSFSGSFANIVPATPGAGLAWDTSTLNSDGTLRVVAVGAPQPRITNAGFSGGQFILSGTNGPANGSYHVLTHTNVSAALNTWTALGPFNFNGSGAFSFTNTPTESRRFYRLQVP